MSFTAVILRNQHAVWAMVVAIVVLGVVAYKQIPVRLFPDTAPPIVNVVTSWPGAAASDVDRELTDPLETEFAALEGVARTSSTSQDNVSVIQVEFHYDTDVRLAAVDVDNAVSRLGGDLPDGAAQPRVLTFSTADRPIFTVGVKSDDLLTARRLAEDVVAPRLQAIDGVAAVDVFGGRIPAVLVDVDPASAEAHRVSLPQIAAAIRTGNVSAPAGRVRMADSESMLRVDQRAERIESLGDRVVALPDGGQVRLDSLASIRQDAAEDDSWFSIDRQRGIAVQVYRSEDANTVAVVAALQEALTELEGELPELQFVPGEESASFTEQSVSNLLGNVWQALVLASVILFLFLGRARAALVTAFTMPLSFGLTFALMWLLGMEFNMVTLSAVILAVGMVVDASVVVLENIVRLRAEGLSPLDAARRGTDEVRLPVLAGVATTVMVLIPLLGLPGFVGKVFGPLATTLLIAFSSSVLVALVLVPILSLRIREEGRVEELAARFSRPFQALMDGLRSAYLRLLAGGLRRRGLVLAVAALSFGLGLAGLRGAGMDLLPRMDSGAFTISLETPSGSSLLKTTTAIQSIEDLIVAQPEVLLVQSQAGFEPGMSFAGGSGVMGPTQGFISVTLTPRTERERSVWEIEESLRREIAAIPDLANVVVKEVGNTAKPTTLAPIVARVSGPDPLVLDRLGDVVVSRLEGVPSVVAPTRTWRRDMRRVLIEIDQRQAAALGQSPLSVARHLAAGAEGIDAGTWSTDGASEPIEVRFAPAERADVDAHLSWPLMVPGAGEVIPTRAVAAPRVTTEQGLYTSVDLNPVLDIKAQVDGRPLNFVVAEAEAALDDLAVPAGYRVTIEGENKDLTESRTSILRALAVSVLAVYLLLVAQFRSWLHPLTVMMAVPLSLAGVSFALWGAGKPVSMPVMVGLVLLVGTVVNNSILLVDVIRKRRDDGLQRRDAILEGVKSRFRPIMMTSLSTVIGMLPLALELALGSERFSPLAVAVIGGLLASTLLTMVVIPVLYDVADGLVLPIPGRGVVTAGAVALIGLAVLPAPANAGTVTLEEAWGLVLEHPAALSSELQVQASQARTHAATGRLLPVAELQARTTQRDPFEAAVLEIPLELPDGSTPDPMQLGEDFDQQTALGITLTQPLFAGGALVQGRRAALAVEAASRAKQKGTHSQLWLDLVRAWYGQIVASEMVEIRTEVLGAARARDESIQRLVARGRAVQLESSGVALKRAEAEQALAEAQAQAAAAEQRLAGLLGVAVTVPKTDVVESTEALFDLRLPVGRPAGVEEAEARAAAAQARGRAQTGALLPSLAFRASAQYANPDMTQFPVENEWGTYWDASLVMTWTLDGGVRWNEARGARLDAEAAHAGSQAMVRQLDVQFGGAMAALGYAPSRMEVAARRVTLAEAAAEAAESALTAGRGTPAGVMEREADVAMARAAQLAVALDIIVDSETARSLKGAFGPQYSSDHTGETP
jgi:multidrug efflux pump subunit AcrB/outer membrane protein TolC